jgi:hypothetical protein
LGGGGKVPGGPRKGPDPQFSVLALILNVFGLLIGVPTHLEGLARHSNISVMPLCWSITSMKGFNLSSDRVLDSQKVTCVHEASYFMIVTYVSNCGTVLALLDTH